MDKLYAGLVFAVLLIFIHHYVICIRNKRYWNTLNESLEDLNKQLGITQKFMIDEYLIIRKRTTRNHTGIAQIKRML